MPSIPSTNIEIQLVNSTGEEVRVSNVILKVLVTSPHAKMVLTPLATNRAGRVVIDGSAVAKVISENMESSVESLDVSILPATHKEINKELVRLVTGKSKLSKEEMDYLNTYQNHNNLWIRFSEENTVNDTWTPDRTINLYKIVVSEMDMNKFYC